MGKNLGRQLGGAFWCFSLAFSNHFVSIFLYMPLGVKQATILFFFLLATIHLYNLLYSNLRGKRSLRRL